MDPRPRRRATAFLLPAVLLLTLLTALAPGGPHPAPVLAGVGTPATGSGAVHGTVPHAGDPCAAACLTPAAIRHQFPGDHPSSPGHPAVPPTGTVLAPPAAARETVRSASRPPAPGEALPHRGRSPPSGV
ncbi:hypothetical protein [Streptomyces chilikensis]|uniref:hypothetical protein n=1 Tax=Streptomyces chilikensis TaxID=1194079 RepID=UPI00140A8C63|nr:hypothetical protein [Streptomyces chilikensis]